MESVGMYSKKREYKEAIDGVRGVANKQVTNSHNQ